MGQDQGTTNMHVDARVVDKNQRNAIGDFSKQAHFKFSAHSKILFVTVDIPLKSTHDNFYTIKNNSSHSAQQQHVAEQKRMMKTNHFDFGPSDGTKMHTKPLDSVQPPGQQNDSFKVMEARQRLS
jgi:hypothetical protein